MPTLVPVEEPKPQTEEQFRQTSGLGNLEFEADMQDVLDPISRLGFDPERALLATKDSTALYSGNFDVVNIGAHYSGSKGVWAHEFRHRGFRMMKDTFDREEFTNKFGEGAAAVLWDLSNEKIVELFDREIRPEDWIDAIGVVHSFEETYDFDEPSFTDQQKDDIIRILSMAAKEAMGAYGKLAPVHPQGMQ